jgi:hypothetical protein
VSTIPDSILEDTKKVLGLAPEYDAFDTDVIMHINTVLSILGQLGVGPADGFMIEDASANWSDFFGEVKLLNPIKTYVYLRVRMFFDPPTTSFLQDAMNKQIEELTWRINVHREGALNPVVVI